MIYCATSVYDGIQVDHIFEAKDDKEAIKFIEANGWELLREELNTEVEFTPWPETEH